MKKLCVLLMCLAMLLTFASCGSTNKYADEASLEAANGYNGLTDVEGEVTGASSKSEVLPSDRKLIKDVTMRVETVSFDAFIEELNESVTSFGGYVESSDINGNSYGSKRNRYATIVARVPAKKVDSFVSGISKNCIVTDKSESVTDVTLTYVDIESHISALKTEEETLLRLLETAENMDDVLAIQGRLSDIRYERQSYESSLRTYDSLITYSTVTINISEVERESEVSEAKNIWEEIGSRFSDSLYSVGKGLRSFFVWFVGSLPHIIIWAVIITAIFFIVKFIISHNKKKAAKKKAKAQSDK